MRAYQLGRNRNKPQIYQNRGACLQSQPVLRARHTINSAAFGRAHFRERGDACNHRTPGAGRSKQAALRLGQTVNLFSLLNEGWEDPRFRCGPGWLGTLSWAWRETCQCAVVLRATVLINNQVDMVFGDVLITQPARMVFFAGPLRERGFDQTNVTISRITTWPARRPYASQSTGPAILAHSRAERARVQTHQEALGSLRQGRVDTT
jgi:hypothetical protein